MAYHAVIGGGMTGLAAARELAKAGKKVLLIEREPELGGLLSSVKIGRGCVEKCYHILFPGNNDIIRLVKETGLGDRLVWNTGTTGFFENGKTYRLSAPYDFLFYPTLTLNEKRKILTLMAKIRLMKSAEKYDSLLAKDWVTKQVGEKTYDKFFKPMINAKFEGDADEISANWFIERMELRNRRNLKGEKLAYLKHGFYQLVDALERELKRDGAIILKNAKLTKIETKNNKVTSITASGKKYDVDAVISTIPPKELEKLVALPKDFLKRFDLPYHGTIGVLIGTKKRVNPYFWTNCLHNKTFKAIVELTNLMPASDYGTHVTYLSSYPNAKDGVWKMSDKKIAGAYIAELLKMYPNLKKSDITSAFVYKNKAAGIIMKKNVATTIKNLGYKTPVRNLFVAGIFNQYPERLLDLSVKAGKEAACEAIK